MHSGLWRLNKERKKEVAGSGNWSVEASKEKPKKIKKDNTGSQILEK